jgi:hypothetical protein
VAVAVGGLDGALLVYRADAVPGVDRVGDNVAAIDDPKPVADKERRPVGNQVSAAVVRDSPQRMVSSETVFVQSLRLLAQPRSNPASCGLRRTCRAKIADGKVGPHEGGMTALARGSGSSPVPSVSALLVRTARQSVARLSASGTSTVRGSHRRRDLDQEVDMTPVIRFGRRVPRLAARTVACGYGWYC